GVKASATRRRPRKTPPPAAGTGTAAAPSAAPTHPAPAVPPAPAPGGVRALAKPPVRKLARDLGVDLTTLTGTGPQGSITRADVEAAAKARAGTAAGAAPDLSRTVGGPGREERIPVKG